MSLFVENIHLLMEIKILIISEKKYYIFSQYFGVQVFLFMNYQHFP